MFGGSRGNEYRSVGQQLIHLYNKRLRPLEDYYDFHSFHSPCLDDSEFEAVPLVLLLGQYSTGKTSFIRYLLKQDYPGMKLGPEPTTDCFTAVMWGDTDGIIPGNALVVDSSMQFRALSKFGNSFLKRFQCSQVQHDILSHISFVDTPGILSGEKQRLQRGYDFSSVVQCLAEKADRILLFFDAHKLDISDEFKETIQLLRGCDEKLRIVLNKAGAVNDQELIRVHGALMWSLGKVLDTPEVVRVYVGSFSDDPLQHNVYNTLFQKEQHDVIRDLEDLPRQATLRKINDFIKRAKLAKAHAYIISQLHQEMPWIYGKEAKKQELIQKLDKTYRQLRTKHNIPLGDLPDCIHMQEQLKKQDFGNLKKLNLRLIKPVDDLLGDNIPRLLRQVKQEAGRAPASTHWLTEPQAEQSTQQAMAE